MTDYTWARNAEASLRVPNFYPDRPRAWKERPIDVRAEAATQVGPEQSNSQIESRRIEVWREHRAYVGAPDAEDRPRRLPVPEIRRRRRAEPGYPSGMIRYAGATGMAYARAWEQYGRRLGLGAASGTVARASQSEHRFRFRLPRVGGRRV